MFESIASRSILLRRIRHWRASTWWPGDSQESVQRALLRILSVAHRERLDTAVLVANLAEEHRGGQRRRLRRLARRLADGTPLVDALEQTPDVLSDEDTLAIRFAQQTGTLSSIYPQLIERSGEASGGIYTRFCQSMIYFGCLLVVMILMISFLMVFIVPTMQQIFSEFSVRFSWPMQSLIACSQFVIAYWPLLVMLAIVAAWLVWSPYSRRFFRRAVATRWMRDAAQIRSAELLRLLSTAVDAGRPLPSALSTLARYHFDQSFRQKLLYARNEVEQGADVWASLVEASLLTPEEVHAVAQSSSDRSRVWTMRRLADWKQQQLRQRSESWAACVEPVITLVFAAVVLWVCVAMFGFLSQIIEICA